MSRRGHLLLAGTCALAVAGVGCGGDDHPNRPRPPAPIEITAKVDDRKVAVSPSRFGAGLVNITVSNQSDDVIELSVDGPVTATGDPIQPNSVGGLRVDFTEGEYEVTPGPDSAARPDRLAVGPERASAQNQLLLP